MFCAQRQVRGRNHSHFYMAARATAAATRLTGVLWPLRSGRAARRGLCFSRVGDIGRATRTFTAEEVATFAALTHDDNPMHESGALSDRGRFERPVVHGMLYASMFGAIVGHRCPGAVYLSQTLQFRRPVYLGDTLTAEVEVSHIAGRGRVVEFETRCTNQEAVQVLDGTARVLLPKSGGAA